MRSRWTELVAPLRASPRLRRLSAAFLVNELGDGIAVMLLPLVVERATGSGLLVGLSFAVAHGSSLVGLPVGGVLADRFDRIRVLRLSFVARGLLLVTAMLVDVAPVTVVCLLAAGLGGSLDNPSAESAIRDGAGEDVRQVATIRKVVRATSGVVGLAVGGLVFGLFGTRAALAVDAATFAVALVLLPTGWHPGWRRGVDREEPAVPGVGAGRRGRIVARVAVAVRTSIADARAGVAHLGGDRDLRLVAWSWLVLGGGVTALLATVVVWFATLAGTPDGAYGWALAAYSIGSVGGLVAAGMVAWRIDARRVVGRTLVVAGIVCAVGTVGADWRMVALSWLLWGLLSAPYEIVTDVVVVRRTPRGLLGRTYAGLSLMGTVGQVVGGIVAGGLTDVVSPPSVILGLGALIAVPGAVVLSRARASRAAHTGMPS